MLLTQHCIVFASGADVSSAVAGRAAFSASRGGQTTLSSSGIMFAADCNGGSKEPSHAWVLAPASLLLPYMTQPARAHLASATSGDLAPGVTLHVTPLDLVTAAAPKPPAGQDRTAAHSAGQAESQRKTASPSATQLPARLACMVQCPQALAQARRTLWELNGGGGPPWRAGWWLEQCQQGEANGAELLATWALLQVDCLDSQQHHVQQQQHHHLKQQHHQQQQQHHHLQQQHHQQQQQHQQGPACISDELCCCGAPSPGQPLVVTGSPFACLAPHHFSGSIVTGCVSNVLPPDHHAPQGPRDLLQPGRSTAAPTTTATSSGSSSSNVVGGSSIHRSSGGGSTALVNGSHEPDSHRCFSSAGDAASWAGSLFLVDAHCYPGMEGAPVTCRSCGRLLGVLTVPLSTSAQHCEVPVAVAACRLLPLAARAIRKQRPRAIGAVAPQPCFSAERSGLAAPLLPAGRQLQSASSASAALQRCLPGVALVRTGGSWASGVSLGNGLLLTNAHLLPNSTAGNSGGGGGGRSGGGSSAIWVCFGGGTGAGGGAWLPAAVLRRFSGYLDIAVLQITQPAGAAPAAPPRSTSGAVAAAAAAAAAGPPSMLPPKLQLQLVGAGGYSPAAAGRDVFVIGHGMFGPRLSWAPSVTRGSLARCVELAPPRRCGGAAPTRRPSMLIVTAAVHSGASGGGLFDGGGRLIGLVTSNTRHYRGATLPRWSYAIAADELAPLWAWAAEGPGLEPSGGGAISARRRGEWLARLEALDLQYSAGHRLWALKATEVAGDEAADHPQPRSKL